MDTQGRLIWLAGAVVGVGMALAGSPAVAHADVESSATGAGPQTPRSGVSASAATNDSPVGGSDDEVRDRGRGTQGVDRTRRDDSDERTVSAPVSRRIAARAAAAADESPGAPAPAAPVVQTVLAAASREQRGSPARAVPVAPGLSVPSDASPAGLPGDPQPDDSVATPYGDIGSWSLQPNGQISDWLGQRYFGDRALLEPVNVVVLDRGSRTPEESAQRLTEDLTAAGFPARTVHSTGYRGLIDGVIYDQEPTGAQEAFSNDFYLLPNDHARFFGPAPAPDGVGYVWTATLSREEVGFSGGQLTHTYVSFVAARDTLRDSLIGHGAADLGALFLGNAVQNREETTGDHDGFAAVVELRATGVRRL
ncbi:hypothetical protein ACN27E_08070 [Mycobacterium sp. WMMD1722]|uniref:hypothetical protein n=1 Tax=Mycobacterium sp. WMMD1722 TaxID=3404117 RepID=UPI003BF5A398